MCARAGASYACRGAAVESGRPLRTICCSVRELWACISTFSLEKAFNSADMSFVKLYLGSKMTAYKRPLALQPLPLVLCGGKEPCNDSFNNLPPERR